MEQIIANLLVADNTVIQKATAELQEAFKHPATIPALCEIVVSSKEPQIRQYSAVLLRKRLSKLRNWHLVPVDQQTIIKNGMLTAIVNEQEKSVRNAIAQFIGVLVRHEFAKKDAWMTDVLQFIFGNCSSADAAQSELGSSIFATLTDAAPDQFIVHIEAICEMFTAALVATESSGNMVTPVIFNIMQGMGNLVPFILGHNGAETTYQKSIPYLVKALQGFAVQEPEKFIQAFDILENLADYTPKLLTGNLKLLIDFCLELAHNAQLEDMARVRAVSFIGWLVRLKKKAIIKQKMVEPIVQVVFHLMATASADGDDDDEVDDEEYFVDQDESSPRTTATQTMDLLALHIPPEKLLPPLLALIEPALKGDDPLAKKAAYLSMAVIAEGCGETICAKYLKLMLDTIKVGIVDPNPIVRNAALFALGQFSEHLQPDITEYAGEVLPILFEFLHQLCAQIRGGGEEPKHIDRMFYALETYCENLNEAIVPHLPVLMERLFEALSPANSVHLRELGLSAVSSTASAAKQHMLPFFQQIITGLQSYLIVSDDEDVVALRPQAIDTLATLARTIGKENFAPLTNQTMTFAMSALEAADEPELRSSLYNLLAAMAEVVNAEMGPVLPKIVERMLDAVKSSEEAVPEFKEDGDKSVNVFGGAGDNAENEDDDDIDIENSDDEDDDEIAGFSVENAFLDEKEEAVLALRQIAEHTGVAFVPYIQPCYEAIYKLLDHPQEDIRKVAIDALTQLVVSLHATGDAASVHGAVTVLIPKLAEIVKTDEECPVVMTVLESYAVLLKELKQLAVSNEDLKTTIFGGVMEVLQSKVACQFNEPLAGAGADDEQEESEYDEALIELAGDVLPKLGEALQPEEFALYFGRVMPLLAAKIEKARRNEELESQRSFAYGTLSECFRPLQSYTATWFTALLPLFVEGVQDDCSQVRQNAVFGLGELVLFSGEKAYDQFPVILQTLSAAVAQEQHAGVLDNICGALARLIMTNYSLIPLDQVLPVFVEHLPLREDYDENGSVFKCFQILFTQGSEALLPVLDRVIMVGLHVLYRKDYKDEQTREYVYNFLKDVRLRFEARFLQVANSSPDIAEFVQTL